MSLQHVVRPVLPAAAGIAITVAVSLSCSLISFGNRPPVIDQNVIITTTTKSDMLEEITGVTTKITIEASDPDGDVLTYRWTSSNGTITGSGPSGTWQRELTDDNNDLVPGTVTVTVSDGRGGEATYTYHG